MKKVLKINNEGYFLEDVVIEDNETIPRDCIANQCPDGFYKPKWNGSIWVEGLTQTEIDAIKKQAQISEIKAELDSLDTVLPRVTEDTWTAIGLDTTKLPQVAQDRLARKQELRNQLRTLTQ